MNFEEDVKNKDFVNGVEHAHALKGVTGNLSLKPLYEMYTKIVNRIRANEIEDIEPLCYEAIDLEKKICEAILSEE
jgi:HPt (histidine-containing phosphotransfer) domain-containing protein